MAALGAAPPFDGQIAWPRIDVDELESVPTMSVLVAIISGAGTRDARACARAIGYLFGPAVVFERIGAPPDTVVSVLAMLEAHAQHGTVPAHVRSDAAFSTTSLPAWTRENPAYALDGERWATVRDAWPGVVHDRDTVFKLQRADVRLLVDMGATRETITALVHAVPHVVAANQYVETPIWARIMETLVNTAVASPPSHAPVQLGAFRWIRCTDDYEEVVAKGPLSNNVAYRIATAKTAADLRHKVNTLYQAMDPKRYFDMTRAGLDYAAAIPPPDDGRVRVPGAFSFPLHSVRTRWLGEIFELHLRHSLMLTMCVAHNEFLAGFLELPDQLSPQMRRAHRVLRRIATRAFAATVDAEILDQCMHDLTHPAVAYTLAVCEEEVRYWIWNTLETVYANDCILNMAQRAVQEQDRRRVREETKWAKKFTTALKNLMLSPEEIVTGVLHGGTITEQWLDDVYDAWMIAHNATDLDIVIPIGTDMWMDALRDEARKRGAIATKMTLGSVRGVLDDVTRVVLARFVLYTFYETPRSFDVVRNGIIAEIARQSSPQYGVQMGQMPPAVAITEDLHNYLSHIWLPLVNHRSSPAMLYAIHAHIPGLDIVPQRHGAGLGILGDDSIEEYVHAHPAAGYAPPPEIAAVTAGELARFVVQAYRDKVAALNWHTAFFEKWTVRNAAELRLRMSYAARLDGHEHLAFLLDVATRGHLMTIPMTITAEQLTQGRFSVPAETWPLYRTWTRARVRWDLTLSFDKGKTRAHETSIAYDVIMRVLSPLEISGSSVLETLRHEYASVPHTAAMLTVACTVQATFQTAARVPAVEDVQASSTCILYIPDY